MTNFIDIATLSNVDSALFKPRDKAPIYGVTSRTRNAEIVAAWARLLGGLAKEWPQESRAQGLQRRDQCPIGKAGFRCCA
jgi:hypothetical protein